MFLYEQSPRIAVVLEVFLVTLLPVSYCTECLGSLNPGPPTKACTPPLALGQVPVSSLKHHWPRLWQQLTESLPYCLAVLTLSLGPSDHHIAKPVVVWMDEWMDGWVDGFLDAWKVDCWMDGWMDGWMDELLDGWLKGWIVGWMDERMDEWIWSVASYWWEITRWKSWAVLLLL